MASLNKVFLIGNLGRDPEVRYTGGGHPVVRISIATNEKRQNKEGNWEKQTEWHNVVFFRRNAEVAEKYLKKGSQIFLEGRLQSKKWEDRDGNQRKTFEIIGNNFIMLSREGFDAGQDRGGDRNRQESQAGEWSPNVKSSAWPKSQSGMGGKSEDWDQAIGSALDREINLPGMETGTHNSPDGQVINPEFPGRERSMNSDEKTDAGQEIDDDVPF